jgi:syntaxin 12/13
MEQNRGGQLINEITNGVQELQQSVQNLEVLVERIGGPQDNNRTKESMNELIHRCNGLSKQINTLMKELVGISNDYKQYKLPRERLMNEYMAVLNRLQAAQRKAVFKEKVQIKTVAAEEEMLSARETREDSTRQIQMQEQHRVNLNELRERQQALHQLESDVNDVNQIFKDLARIVHEQGDMVDSIEANVEHASIHVEQGNVHVRQALHYQTKARQKKLLLLIFFIALFLILALGFYLWSR